MGHLNIVTSDLTEASFEEAIKTLRDEKLSIKPTHIVMPEWALEQAVTMAKADPEFARMVREQFNVDLLSM